MSPRAILGAPWPAWKHGLIAGIGIAILGGALSASPWLWAVQESFDLWALFKLRGPRTPPDDIVLVTIDQQSSDRIALPANPDARARCLDLKVGEAPPSYERLPPPHLVMRWPRCLHGRVVRALAGAGEGDTACRTFAEVVKRYPKQPAAFMQRLQQEKTKAQCPA